MKYKFGFLILIALYPLYLMGANWSGGSSVALPTSSTDNGVVRWDGTTGSKVQNSSNVTIGDTGAVVIDLSADVEGLIVQNHSSQSAKMITVENSGGTDLFTVDFQGSTVTQDFTSNNLRNAHSTVMSYSSTPADPAWSLTASSDSIAWHSMLKVTIPKADVRGFAIKAHGSQTGNLQEWINGSDAVLLSVSSAGNIVGNGALNMSGVLRKQVAATATTITAAQCGSTFINTGAVEIELPEASTVLGCELTFIVGNASNFHVDPDAGDQIVLSTNAAGDRLLADAIGEVLVIEAISASAWAPKDQTGTWTDAD